jgi:uncharacterized protein YndB with AHSA1/START domain
MSGTPLAFERHYEFPRIIVWDALVDPVLVSGWLAEAVITPEVGGEYNLHWLHKVGQPESFGRISVMTPLERLDVDTHDVGRLVFELEELDGGSRGTSTRLTLTVDSDVEPAFHGTIRADWLTSLDQLEDLLRGHPVDWSTWDRDRRETWSRYLDDAGDSVG